MGEGGPGRAWRPRRGFGVNCRGAAARDGATGGGGVGEGGEGGMRGEGRGVLRVPEELRGWQYLYCFMRSRTGDFSPSVCVDLKDAGVR